MKKELPAWLVLSVIALVAGLLLGFTNNLTAKPIEEANLRAANQAREKVLPEAETFHELSLGEGSGLDNCFEGLRGDAVAGYVAQATVKGYGGPIEVVVGIDMQGVVTGVSVGGSGFSETAGLGAKTKDEAFSSQFKGLADKAALKENVDSVTGASISSGAVVNGVNACREYLRALLPTPEQIG